MISIVICHREKKLLAELIENIEATIGTQHELIVIDNHANKRSIFQAYNLGVMQSKGEIICFVHEDVLFHTENWGQKLINHFEKDKSIGLIGVIGGTALPACPAPWWNNHALNNHYVNLVQHWDYKDITDKWEINKPLNKQRTIIHHRNNPSGKMINRVAAVDGLFFAVPKPLFKVIRFDENNFDGFHGYDIDTCLQIKENGFDVVVVHDITIEHFSKGKTNKKWNLTSIKLAEKWLDQLPIVTQNPSVSEFEKKQYTIDSLLTFCFWAKNQVPDTKIREVILKFLPVSFYKPISKNHQLLIIWQKVGYQIARIIFRFTKHFAK